MSLFHSPHPFSEFCSFLTEFHCLQGWWYGLMASFVGPDMLSVIVIYTIESNDAYTTDLLDCRSYLQPKKRSAYITRSVKPSFDIASLRDFIARRAWVRPFHPSMSQRNVTFAVVQARRMQHRPTIWNGTFLVSSTRPSALHSE